jgi:hypothetical protein
MTKAFRGVALTAAVMMSVSSAACIGKFGAFHKLLNWNNSLGNKWLDWAVFLGLNIIPVYELFFIGDVLIFNSVEFWTGNNPLAATEVQGADGRKTSVSWKEDGHRILIETTKEGRIERTLDIALDDERAEVRRDGVLVSTAEFNASGMRIRDASGELVASHTPEQMTWFRAAAERGTASLVAALEAQATGMKVAKAR